MAIMSRNISCNVAITAPDTTAVGQPFQFRIVQGYSKMPVSSDLHSVTGVSGAFEGVVISFNSDTVYETAAYDTFHDTIGNTLGVPDPTGSIARKTTHVGSDRATTQRPRQEGRRTSVRTRTTLILRVQAACGCNLSWWGPMPISMTAPRSVDL